MGLLTKIRRIADQAAETGQDVDLARIAAMIESAMPKSRRERAVFFLMLAELIVGALSGAVPDP